MATSPPTARRTQGERSAQTRSRLLEATIESLLEVGYAGTTTRRVTELAGVSQGAQTHHFPHRVDLVASAFEQLAAQRLDRFKEKGAGLPTDRATRLRALLDLVWDDFASQLFTVAVKLWVAAADDPELRERLVPVEKRINSGIVTGAREVAGDLADDPDFDRMLAVAMNTAAGLALVRSFAPTARPGRDDAWAFHRAVLERGFSD
ncbi:TetR/AcrR family transcriptional regulator [soil metagenome]